MFVGIRLKDDAVARIDALAEAEGMTRSRWIVRQIEAGAGGAQKPDTKPRRVRGERTKLHLRVDAKTVDAIDKAASKMGLKRNQWIARAIDGRLVKKGQGVRPAPYTKEAIGAAISGVHRIGRNINQAVRAMHEASTLGQHGEMKKQAEQLQVMKEDLWRVILDTQSNLIALGSAEQDYWTSRDD
jgi:uncharacterized protein (DUF1778 family)